MPCATSDKEKVLISMQICDCLSHNNGPPAPAPAFYAKAGAQHMALYGVQIQKYFLNE